MNPQLYTEPIGLMGYQLYRLGWQNGSRRHLAAPSHWLLSVFLVYRQGFRGGAEWVRGDRVETQHLN
jgi:hypothetical protein